MSPIEEKLSEQFFAWEIRGRGWQVWQSPVSLEPPFRPFQRHFQPDTAVVDDGRRPTFLSSLVEKLSRKLATLPPETSPVPTEDEEPEPESLVRESLIELQVTLPEKLDIPGEEFEQFLLSLSLCHEPVSFELVGVGKKVTAQFAAHPSDSALVMRQLQAYFPDALFQRHESTLETVFDRCEGEEALVVEFGLGREFMYPLASNKYDAFVGIVGALSELATGEFGLFQVLWQPVRNPWPESIVNSVTNADGKPFFVNEPELADAAENKIDQPLFAVVVRMMIRANDFDRVLQLSRDLVASLRVFAKSDGNELIPLSNEEYPFTEHVEDALLRQTRRSGMILNSDELMGFVHLPGSSVRSAVLERDAGKTKAAPDVVRHAAGLLLGENIHAGITVPVRLSADQRVRHTHIIGSSGSGKSTLLFNLIRQDIENGDGVAVLDPHGDLIDKILGIIPESRISDVVLVDPSDADFPIGFNILAAHSGQEKTLLASDLVSMFRRYSSSWGDQMDIVFKNSILAVLESSRSGTLADVRRFLIEPAYRAEFLRTVQDPELVYYWQKVFPQLTGNRSIGPVVTRLQDFLSQKPIRNMVLQQENKLDFASIMDAGKIFLARLPEGLLGSENSYLLGTLLVSKFQQIAMSRQAQAASARRDYWLYIDEFDCFITPTMAEILKGARKYRLGLTLAHQELHQLKCDEKVASAVATHPCTRIVFQVSDDDAKKLAGMFTSFDAESLKTLEKFHSISRVERSDCDFNLRVRPFEPVDGSQTNERRNEVVTASRKKYGTPAAKVETILRESWKIEEPEGERDKERTARTSTSASANPTVSSVAHSRDPSFLEVPKEAVRAMESSNLPSQFARKPFPAHENKQTVQANLEALPPRELGRGGSQHQAIQKRIKLAAEALGFRSTIEKEVLNGTGSVDLLLERGEQIIGCEIAISGLRVSNWKHGLLSNGDMLSGWPYVEFYLGGFLLWMLLSFASILLFCYVELRIRGRTLRNSILEGAKKKWKPQANNPTDNSVRSALHLAAAEGHMDVIKFALASKFDVNVRDKLGHTPTYWAIKNGHTEVAEYLRRRGGHE